MPVPRLAPELPLPPYSYVTGRFPHPTRDPAGHSYGHVEAGREAFDPSHWRDSRTYLHAIDLFNHGYYWESHEEWEGIWHACGRAGAAADFLKGLIKLAAAGVKVREGRPEGVRRHALRAKELLSWVRESAGAVEYGGFVLEDLIAIAERITDDPPRESAERAPVEIVFDFQLSPRIDSADW